MESKNAKVCLWKASILPTCFIYFAFTCQQQGKLIVSRSQYQLCSRNLREENSWSTYPLYNPLFCEIWEKYSMCAQEVTYNFQTNNFKLRSSSSTYSFIVYYRLRFPSLVFYCVIYAFFQVTKHRSRDMRMLQILTKFTASVLSVYPAEGIAELHAWSGCWYGACFLWSDWAKVVVKFS